MSGDRLEQWHRNRRIILKINGRNRRLRRLMREGVIKPMSKAEMQQLCDAAAQGLIPRSAPATTGQA